MNPYTSIENKPKSTFLLTQLMTFVLFFKPVANSKVLGQLVSFAVQAQSRFKPSMESRPQPFFLTKIQFNGSKFMPGVNTEFPILQ